LAIVDVHDPAAPAIRSFYLTKENAYDIAVADQRAYLVLYSELQILDVHDPSHPLLLGRLPVGAGFSRIQAVDHLVYLAASEFLVIDVQNPANPIVLGRWGTLDLWRELVVLNDRAYVATHCETHSGYCRQPHAQLDIISVHDPYNPVQLGRYTTTWIKGLQVADNFAYIGIGLGVAIIDVRRPATPLLRSSYLMKGHPENLQLVGNMLVDAHSSDGVHILRIHLDRLPPQILLPIVMQ
jgi:hypothetical protein